MGLTLSRQCSTLAAIIGVAVLLTACATEPPAPPPASTEFQPSPCKNRDHEWDGTEAHILKLNPGYVFQVVEDRATFIERFNALPPPSTRAVPDLIGYFSKPGEKAAILVFVSGPCTGYLEVVSHAKVRRLMDRPAN